MQTKLCCIPCEHIVTVGLTKIIFAQYFIVQNYKNSNTRIIIACMQKQISILGNVLNFCMHVHIIISRL
jgi:hypothetical protein